MKAPEQNPASLTPIIFVTQHQKHTFLIDSLWLTWKANGNTKRPPPIRELSDGCVVLRAYTASRMITVTRDTKIIRLIKVIRFIG